MITLAVKDEKLSGYQQLFGLIGYPVAQSFSKKYFGDKFLKEGLTQCYYELFPVKDIAEFPELIRRYPNLKGLNVTRPHKESVMPYLDFIEEGAQTIGAVNTIKIDKGKLFGYNTDAYGFEKSLRSFLNEKQPKPVQKALVLGTGGASKAVVYILKKMKIEFALVSRSVEKGKFTYQDLSEKIFKDFQLIINTTPLGMAPKTDTCPELNYALLGSHHFLYDLVYNPEKTVFLAKGENQGCSIMNGLPMLHLQAQKAWEIWNL